MNFFLSFLARPSRAKRACGIDRFVSVGTKIVVCLALVTLWILPALAAQSTASITPAAPDASGASDAKIETETANRVSLGQFATGEMANFVPADEPTAVPDIGFTDLAESPTSLQTFYGKTLVVNFWATWCAPCRRELPSLDRLQHNLGTNDLAVIAISIDRRGADKVTPFLEEISLPNLGIYLDKKNKLGRSFGAFGLPTTVLINRQGIEVGRLVGPAEWDSDESVALIRHLIGDGKISAAVR